MDIGNRPNNYTFYEGYEDENAIVDNKVVLYFHCAQQGRKIETRTGKTNSRIFFVESLCHLRYNKKIDTVMNMGRKKGC